MVDRSNHLITYLLHLIQNRHEHVRVVIQEMERQVSTFSKNWPVKNNREAQQCVAKFTYSITLHKKVTDGNGKFFYDVNQKSVR